MANPMAMIRTNIQRFFIHRKFGRQLKPLIDRSKNIGGSDILLVACLRNELLRMPYFCDYYRKLGVNHFLLIDNDSNDGFADWAREQLDVSVWHTTASYKASKFGMEWCNVLLRKYGSGHLCVTVDPDEFLVYPHMETRNLRELGEFMKGESRETMHAVMLDAYSDKPLDQTHYEFGDNPFEVCKYFDADGYTQVVGSVQGHFTRGGPRMRVHNRFTPEKSPALNKIPLVWWRWNYRYSSSMHDMRPLRLNLSQNVETASITGCLFHFKFLSTMATKADEEMRRKQHYESGREYQQYLEQDNPILFEEGISVAYSGWDQLIRLGLMSSGRWF